MAAHTTQSRLQAGRVLARADQQSLKAHNLALVLSMVATADHPMSRADLAEVSGLTRATVSSLVATLIGAGFIAEDDPEASPRRPGRPAIPLRLAMGSVAAIGLEANVDYLGVRAVDITGAVLAEHIEHRDLRGSDPDDTLAHVVRVACPIVSDLTARGTRIVGAGLALPGIADHPSGPLRMAPNLGWRDVDILTIAERTVAAEPSSDLLRSVLVDHLIVDNEANLAARVEIGGHPSPSFIYVSGEVGIGAAIVVEGRVFSGLHGWAGELGHTAVDPNGGVCACGASGCLELYAGKASMMRAAGLQANADVADLVDALQNQDQAATRAVSAAAQALGIALANCMNTVDVPQIVLGGDFAPLAEVLSPGLTRQLSQRVLASRWVDDLVVRAAIAGPYPAITGGAMVALDPVMANPLALVD